MLCKIIITELDIESSVSLYKAQCLIDLKVIAKSSYGKLEAPLITLSANGDHIPHPKGIKAPSCNFILKCQTKYACRVTILKIWVVNIIGVETIII